MKNRAKKKFTCWESQKVEKPESLQKNEKKRIFECSCGHESDTLDQARRSWPIEGGRSETADGVSKDPAKRKKETLKGGRAQSLKRGLKNKDYAP